MADFTRRAWRGLAPNSSGLIETANYVWNTNTLAWEAASVSAAAGGDVNVLNFPATQAVSGPLTNTQLRATPVDVASPTYATRLDEASASISYLGKAVTGTATNSLAWQVQRITISGELTIVEFADGDALFNNSWDNRASLTYS